MKRQDNQHLRNIGIMAHIDAGKTTTTERILYYTGLTHKVGEVHDGNAIMDWMAQEQERGITITSAATTCFWEDNQINIIDTPGHVDFTVEVERCLRILDGAVFLLDAKAGVEAQTKVVWHQADYYQVPRLIFINKMDVVGADFYHSIETVEKELDGFPIPIQIPMGSEKDFEGIISLVTMKAYYNTGDLGQTLDIKEIPEDYLAQAEKYRSELLEAIADEDDDLLNRYLEGQDLPQDMIVGAIRKATIHNRIIPVLCGSAFKNKSIQPLLDAIVDYLPSPLDRPLIHGHTTDGEPIILEPDSSQPFSALIFKVMSDPFVGRLAYARIYSGHINVGKSIYNVSKKKKVRSNKILQMHANNRTEVDRASAGDIIALIGLKFAGTGDTLSDLDHPVLLESIDFPEPVISMALEPKKSSDTDKMLAALDSLAEEDPTLITFADKETGQRIISGMGELHLEIILDRLSKEFNVEVNSGKPRVNYKESITKPSTASHTLSQSIGNQSIYASVAIAVEPRERGSGHKIYSNLSGPHLPKAFIEAALEGIKGSLGAGIIDGYEVIDLDISLTDLDFDESTSTDIGFMTAASLALSQALRDGDSKLLEPFFTVTIHSPEAYIGDIMDDIQKRKGAIVTMELLPKSHKIIATVPLSQLFGYATDIRSITHGNGHYTMVFSHYDFVK